MPTGHSIHLREPWNREPCDQGVRYSRTFNWPAGVGPEEQIWIVAEPRLPQASFSLNGTLLGGELEVTHLIRRHNRLEIVLPSDAEGKLPCEVRLNITQR